MHIGKRTKLQIPWKMKQIFDVKPPSALFDYKSFSTIANVAKAKFQQQVNLQGRFTFQGINETLIAK